MESSSSFGASMLNGLIEYPNTPKNCGDEDNGFSKFCTEENSQMEIKQRYVVLLLLPRHIPFSTHPSIHSRVAAHKMGKKENYALGKKKMGKFVACICSVCIAGECGLVVWIFFDV